jgi:hypothetical protein
MTTVPVSMVLPRPIKSEMYEMPDCLNYNGEVIKDSEGTIRRHGQGSCTFRPGDKWEKFTFYEGNWELDQMSGHGVLTYKDGVKFEGGWKDGLKDGNGVLWLRCEWVFDGSFSQGHPKEGILKTGGHKLFSVKFDGKSDIMDLHIGDILSFMNICSFYGVIGWSTLVPYGEIISGKPEYGKEWDGIVKLEKGVRLIGDFKGLRRITVSASAVISLGLNLFVFDSV